VNGTAALLLALTAVVAVGDWMVVSARNRRLEYVLKPLTTIGLIAVAVAVEPRDPAARVLFVIALVLSLGGDVLLMLPNRERFFPFGLGSFLLAHLAYIPGLMLLGVSGAGLIAGFVVALVGGVAVGRRILPAVGRTDPSLTIPVTVYLSVILAMFVVATGTALPFAIAGAALFCISDAVIAFNEFGTSRPRDGVVVMVTYHLAQALLVLALVSW
jgi:uncharacterized membrane protein YhhN